jgi:N-dimethylarginine dimethylaminohydrolase
MVEINEKEYTISGRKFKMTDYPDYVGNMPPDPVEIHNIDYLDEIEKIWGRKWGDQGIGQLKEVALVMATDHENHEIFLDKQNQEYFMMTYGEADIHALRGQQEDYARVLKEEGVGVKLMEYGDPWGAYGPMRKMFVGALLGTVLRNGVILRRYGQGAYLRGLNRHTQRFFTDIDCPISLQITGKGILEPAWPWVAEGVVIGGFGRACNREGLEQALPVFKAAGLREVVMGGSSSIHSTMQSSGAFHMDGVLNIVDCGLAVVYPPQLDFGVYKWLSDHGIEMIEVPPEEQHLLPCNGMLLEPGKLIQGIETPKTNRELEKHGVEVIEVETSQIKMGGVNGIRCITCRLHREPGPELEEVARRIPKNKPEGLVNFVSGDNYSKGNF